MLLLCVENTTRIIESGASHSECLGFSEDLLVWYLLTVGKRAKLEPVFSEAGAIDRLVCAASSAADIKAHAT